MNEMDAFPQLAYIFQRRSIRKFSSETVSDMQIEGLLKAAMAAPSAMNNQPWEFVVINDPSVLEEIRRALIFGRHVAPLAIAVCGNKRKVLQKFSDAEFWIQDCSAATQNILLAASSSGLGAVWLGVYPVKEFVNRISKILSLPRNVIPLSIIYIGYPAEQKEAHTKYDVSHISWQHFNQKKEDII
jgi:nitroreductase